MSRTRWVRSLVPPGLGLVAWLLVLSSVEAGSGREGKAKHRFRLWPRRPAPMSNDQMIYCLGKSAEQVVRDFGARMKRHDVIVGTKATRAQYEAVAEDLGAAATQLRFDSVSGVMSYSRRAIRPRGRIVVASAGGADLPVAEEAARIAEAMGNRVARVYDLGASPSKTSGRNRRLFEMAKVIISVGGSDGRLSNAIASQTKRPVVAVPTSAGYGTGIDAFTGLKSTLQKSAPGSAAVNVDNGPGAANIADKINKQSRRTGSIKPGGLIVVATAGTADIPVAEQAARTAEAMGHRVQRAYDIGVNDPKKIHRNRRLLNRANVIIAAAGMEANLSNAIAALTDRPVIGVPTSVGYGTGSGGNSALMGMLNQCSPGAAVVAIDNGVGAAKIAGRINQQSRR